ncbi:MobC family plasmid mobilization relaxosome protein [Bifidobacterium callimiconis]|uniref:Conjugal transfer protein TrbI n=1 Tax=Bifidobacterium callimiconis TaxID=2306973 RepID=A0A430FEP4_9BIFI|nr:MobC family plasmid mobilization relaxosome protein [Bifidobacterium callimiconis]RSX51280.1 conjugal transfer protein TrbI [Bifidobacterium callimiconis]
MNWARGRQRSISKLVAFTPEEWAEIQETYELWARGRGAGGSFSAFAREIMTNGSVKVIEPTWDPELTLRQLRPIGVNVNQIARRVNADDTASMAAVAELRAEMNDLIDTVGRMCSEYRVTVREA